MAQEIKKEMAGVWGQSEDDVSTKQSLHRQPQADSGAALQSFLDRIPISSLPGINNSPAQVFELRADHSVRDAVCLLYKNNVSGAPIADAPSDTARRFSDRYIGFVDLATLVLWSLEEIETDRNAQPLEELSHQNDGHTSFFSMLDQNSRTRQTKVIELAKSFLLDPFLPVRLEDSLFHVLLLLSKHRVQVLPVIEPSKCQVIGFVTQNAVIQLLLQSTGLEWFDSISDQAISEYRSITVEAFIHMEPDDNARGDPTIDQDLRALLKPGLLCLKNGFYPRMDSPITSKKSDTLKQAMKKLEEAKCDSSFLLDNTGAVRGVLTSRDVITQFAPPSTDSRFRGGHGFFESALEQTGCHVEDGQLIQDK
ncbi:SNF1-related protein kinase regulatory subunit gamma-1-like isoform X2 [Punica granatum]|uniref:SNF1-related protein kinase regulatory subunit gamma-1-like isoform X2 n=1 Tax=Punica granatum TaxID=22663 RepID=A0A6P8CCA4_PUNGR|nr:SNF1-related protein kinase regulatory subunit gamma-1-like isoform X2 [Punica granatum]